MFTLHTVYFYRICVLMCCVVICNGALEHTDRDTIDDINLNSHVVFCQQHDCFPLICKFMAFLNFIC